MSEEVLSWRIDLPFESLEACWTSYQNVLVRLWKISSRRVALTAGSVRYILTLNEHHLCTFNLFFINRDLTLLTITPSAERVYNEVAKTAYTELARTLINTHTVLNDKVSHLPVLQASVQTATNVAMPALEIKHVQPSRNASADEWLDWRAGETQRTGNRITLDKLSEQSGISLDILKKASARRRH